MDGTRVVSKEWSYVFMLATLAAIVAFLLGDADPYTQAGLVLVCGVLFARHADNAFLKRDRL